ncbi:helix-turn-helix domain-containing protein [Arthrobacter sp. 92]|uniref:helix-turn-helix domain-containing protein n=1 Tax=Arthrobacter sp. 92 TaxID=3418175 RepID=UPI003D042797
MYAMILVSKYVLEEAVVERVLVTIDEAAEALGVGRTMVYQLIRECELVPAKIGRRSLVTAESVRDYAGKVSGTVLKVGGSR